MGRVLTSNIKSGLINFLNREDAKSAKEEEERQKKETQENSELTPITYPLLKGVTNEF